MKTSHLNSTAIAAVLALALMGPAFAASKRPVPLNIPAQSLDESLRSLGVAAERQIVFSADLVAGKQSKAVVGSYTAEDALKRLLTDTDLAYEERPSGVLMVMPRGRPRGMGSRTQLDRTDAGDTSARPTQVAQADAAPRRADVPTIGIEEVVVTATKRAERLLDIPVSIAAISAEEIAQRGLVSAEDYLRGLPGANHVESNFGPAIVIRGLETTTTSQNFASGSTTAMYFGETPTTSSTGITGGSGADLKLVDIERIEVLRGPQGTAFGSSALGGVVRVIPKAPKLDGFEAMVKAGASLTSGTGGDNQMAQGAINIPVVEDKFAVRAAAYRFEDSGYYRNVAGSDPTLAGAVTRFRVPSSIATNEEEVGGSTFTGGRVAALFQPTDQLKLTATYVNQKTNIDAWAGSNREGYNQAIFRVGPEALVYGETRGGRNTDVEFGNAVLEYDLGWADLLATYSHIDGGSYYAFPWSSFGINPMVSSTRGRHDEDNGEIRLATKFDGAWNFLAGVYAEKLNDVWTQVLYWNADLATIPFASSVPYTPPGILNSSINTLELTQKAAFGEVTWEIVPGLKATGGIRHYKYDRSSRTDEYGALTAPTASATLRTTAGVNEASGTNFRANLSYKVNEDTLVYAGYAEGFRLGKPQPGLAAGLCDTNGDGTIDNTNIPLASTREILSDSVESWEVGAKSTLGGRVALSADAFRTSWTDIPVQVRVTCAGGIVAGYTANATRARSQGLEGQVGVQVTEALRIDLGASYIDAHLTQDALGLAPPAFKGDNLPSPEVNATLSAQYAFMLGEYDAYVRADSVYVDAFSSRLPPAVANTSDEYVKIDASAGVMLNNVSFDVYVRNLTNQDAVTFAPQPYPALRLRPRTIGMQLGYQF